MCHVASRYLYSLDFDWRKLSSLLFSFLCFCLCVSDIINALVTACRNYFHVWKLCGSGLCGQCGFEKLCFFGFMQCGFEFRYAAHAVYAALQLWNLAAYDVQFWVLCDSHGLWVFAVHGQELTPKTVNKEHLPIKRS